MTRKVKQTILSPYFDHRGVLLALQEFTDIPFVTRRVYTLVGVEPSAPRGFHAHLHLEQYLVCLRGSCTVVLDDGHRRKEYLLEEFGAGLLISGLIWREIYNLTANDVLLVLASELYDENDYVRDYEEFTDLAKKMQEIQFE